MEFDKDRLDRALLDLEEIKRTLREDDREPSLKPWVFLSWTIVIALATVASRLLTARLSSMPTPRLERTLLVAVWLPALLVGGSLEFVAWVSKVRDEHGVVMTDRTRRFMASGIGIMVCAGTLFWSMLGAGVPIAGPVLLISAIVLFLYSEFSFPESFPEIYVLAAGGIVATALRLSGPDWTAGAGLAVSAVMFVSWLRYRGRDRVV